MFDKYILYILIDFYILVKFLFRIPVDVLLKLLAWEIIFMDSRRISLFCGLLYDLKTFPLFIVNSRVNFSYGRVFGLVNERVYSRQIINIEIF